MKKTRADLPTFLMRTTLAGALSVLVFGGAVAAQQTDERMGWQPYLGCWERPQPSGDAAANAVDAAAAEGVLCFVANEAGVEMLTVVAGAITHREPFPADGQPRTIEQDGCRGTEQARFSADRRRIYTASQISCDDGAERQSTGIISMPNPSAWLDVRAMETGGESAAWSQWYWRASSEVLTALGISTGQDTAPLALRGAASYAAAPIAIDHVIDATQNVDSRAVEAWIAEAGQPFAHLDSDDLVRLDDAGVPGHVIDVVVAVSFPNRFALNRQAAHTDDAVRSARAARPIMIAPGYYDPYWGGYGYSPYYNRYGRYGYGGYWGYGGYGWGGGYYRPVIVEIAPAEQERGGRWVAGRGYRGARPTAGSAPPRTGGGESVRSSGGSRGSAATGSDRSTGGRKARPKGGKG